MVVTAVTGRSEVTAKVAISFLIGVVEPSAVIYWPTKLGAEVACDVFVSDTGESTLLFILSCCPTEANCTSS
jgi:hypothetical protein